MPCDATLFLCLTRFSFWARADLEPPFSFEARRSGLELTLLGLSPWVELETTRFLTPILGLLNWTLFEFALEAKSSLLPVILLSFSIFLAWSIEGSGSLGPPDAYLFALFRPRKVPPFELFLSIMELGPFYFFAPKFVML